MYLGGCIKINVLQRPARPVSIFGKLFLTEKPATSLEMALVKQTPSG